jgi:hypothetical protein
MHYIQYVEAEFRDQSRDGNMGLICGEGTAYVFE